MMLGRQGSLAGGGGFAPPAPQGSVQYGGYVPPEARGQTPYSPYGQPQGYPQPGFPQYGFPQQQQSVYPSMPAQTYPTYPQPPNGNYPPNPQAGYPPQSGYPHQGGYPPAQQFPTAQPTPSAATGPVAGTYTLSLSARNLRDKDTFSKSDPYCKVLQRSGGGWKNLGRTETINDDLFPIWQKRITVRHQPTTGKYRDGGSLKFEIWDHDTFSDDKLGKVETTMDAIVRAQGMRLTETIKYGSFHRNGGTLTITAQRIGD